jgi:hypothetical protein
MSSLLRFVLAVLASPFKSKARLEAENAVLRHQLIVFARAQGSMANATQSAMHLLSADGARPLGSREHILLKVNPPPRTVIVFVQSLGLQSEKNANCFLRAAESTHLAAR